MTLLEREKEKEKERERERESIPSEREVSIPIERESIPTERERERESIFFIQKEWYSFREREYSHAQRITFLQRERAFPHRETEHFFRQKE